MCSGRRIGPSSKGRDNDQGSSSTHQENAAIRTRHSSARRLAIDHLPAPAKQPAEWPSASGPTQIDSLAQWAAEPPAAISPRVSGRGHAANRYSESQGLWDSLVSDGDAADDAHSASDQSADHLPTICEEGQGLETVVKPLHASGVHVTVTLGSPKSGSSKVSSKVSFLLFLLVLSACTGCYI